MTVANKLSIPINHGVDLTNVINPFKKRVVQISMPQDLGGGWKYYLVSNDIRHKRYGILPTGRLLEICQTQKLFPYAPSVTRISKEPQLKGQTLQYVAKQHQAVLLENYDVEKSRKLPLYPDVSVKFHPVGVYMMPAEEQFFSTTVETWMELKDFAEYAASCSTLQSVCLEGYGIIQAEFTLNPQRMGESSFDIVKLIDSLLDMGLWLCPAHMVASLIAETLPGMIQDNRSCDVLFPLDSSVGSKEWGGYVLNWQAYPGVEFSEMKFQLLDTLQCEKPLFTSKKKKALVWCLFPTK